MILTAMSDQTAAMNRMADAVAGILTHLDPKQAGKFAAPDFKRPLASYATFDWASIDATVTQSDRHGATEVEYNGAVFRRYRSNDDDPKGVDIRFRRVVSGTPQDKNMVWASLVKFADYKKKDPPKPLRGELADTISDAQKAAVQQPKPVAVAVAPTTRAPQPAAYAPPPTVLEKLQARFNTLPNDNTLTATLRQLKADINTQALPLSVLPFEAQAGEPLPDAVKRMRAVLDEVIARSAVAMPQGVK